MDIIVPVKCFARAKSRLGPVFNGALRRQLARVMAQSVLAELGEVRGLGRILIVTSEMEMMETSRAAGIQALWDDGNGGLNGALARAEKMLGFPTSGVGVVSADLPFFRAAELERMIEAHEKLGREAVTIARDQAGTGTNVRLVSAHDRLPYLFGKNSAEAHARAARERGLAHQIFESATFALDLDTPANAIEAFRLKANNVDQARAVTALLSSGLSEISGELRSWNSEK